MGRVDRLLRTELPFVLVIAAFLAAVIVLLAAPGTWRPATVIMGVALVGAALARLVLPRELAGLLAVRRSRGWDVLSYLVLGAVILGVDIRVH